MRGGELRAKPPRLKSKSRRLLQVQRQSNLESHHHAGLARPLATAWSRSFFTSCEALREAASCCSPSLPCISPSLPCCSPSFPCSSPRAPCFSPSLTCSSPAFDCRSPMRL